MPMSIQNRSVLYKIPEPVLVPEGVYEAELVEVKEFSNAFGNRVGLVFKITTGQVFTYDPETEEFLLLASEGEDRQPLTARSPSTPPP